jgi:hypothetical protein
LGGERNAPPTMISEEEMEVPEFSHSPSLLERA